MAGDRHDRPAIDNQREKDIERAGPVDELLGAIEGIGQPEPGRAEPGGVIEPFLGEDGISWERRREMLPDQSVRREIGVGYWRSVRLGVNRGIRGVLIAADDVRGRLHRRHCYPVLICPWRSGPRLD